MVKQRPKQACSIAASLPGGLLRIARWRPWEPMEFPSKTVGMTGKRSGLGRCRHFFWLGVVFDTVGVAVLFTGVFADVLFYDMLLYLGSIIIFFSLLWWVSWYTGNIELLSEDSMPKALRPDSRSMVDALRRSISLRFSQTFANFSHVLERLRQRRLRGPSLRSNLKTCPQTLLIPSQEEWEWKDEDRGMRVEDSGRTQHVCKKDAGPVPGDDGRSKAAGSPGPTTAGRTHLERPVFPLYSIERRPPFPILPSKSQLMTPSVSALPPGALSTSKSEVIFPSTSASQPPVALPLTSQPVTPVVPKSHPPVPVSSQDHVQVPVTPQSHVLVPVATQNQTLPPSPQTQPLSVQDSERKTSTPQASEMPLPSTQSFQTMDLQASPDIQDFMTVYHSQQLSSNDFLLPISETQSSEILEISRKIVAQVYESLSLTTQRLCQELSDTMSPVPEAADPAAESQPSLSTDNADPAADSPQSLPTHSADSTTESQEFLPTDSALALGTAKKSSPH